MKNYKLVMNIIGLTVLINENTELCTFVDFAGHVSKVSIRVYAKKETEELPIKKFDLYYDHTQTDWLSEDDIRAKLEDVENLLRDYLFNTEITKES